MSRNRVFSLFVMLLSMLMVNSPIVHAKNVGVWEKVCGDQANPKTCRIRQDLFLQKKNNEGKLVTLGRVLRLNVVYSNVDNGTKRIPFLIRRYRPDNTYEDWRLTDFINI